MYNICFFDDSYMPPDNLKTTHWLKHQFLEYIFAYYILLLHFFATCVSSKQFLVSFSHLFPFTPTISDCSYGCCDQ